MRPRIVKSLPVYHRPPREGMSAAHLDNIRLLPCCCCGGVTCITAHHLLRSGEHGTGRKSSDRWALPLCCFGSNNNCHQALHDDGNEDRFLSSRGIDGRALATALWAERGNLESMLRIVFRALQGARLKGRVT